MRVAAGAALRGRQAQTAITTFHFLQDGVKWDYITPILGPPWEIPLEFPLFQACTAWLVQATGLELDVAVPAIERGAMLPTSGLSRVAGARERTVQFVRALGEGPRTGKSA